MGMSAVYEVYEPKYGRVRHEVDVDGGCEAIDSFTSVPVT